MRRLKALIGPRPDDERQQRESERVRISRTQPKRKERQKTLPQIFAPIPLPEKPDLENIDEEPPVSSRKTQPFPFSTDTDSARPPFKSITREKTHHESQADADVESRKTMLLPSPPKPQGHEALLGLSPSTVEASEPSPQEVRVPIQRKLMDTMVHIDPDLIPAVVYEIPEEKQPERIAPPKKSSIGSIMKASRKRITLAVLAGIALGMAGNAAYYYHHKSQQQPKIPAPKLDNPQE